MTRIAGVTKIAEIPPSILKGPVGLLLQYHNLATPYADYSSAQLLIGMCMDHRKQLRIPENFAYIIRSGGANLRLSEFKVSYAISIGGVRAIALIAHTQCGMVNLAARREQFVTGLIEGAGWDRDTAAAHFDQHAPMFEIGNEVQFVLSETNRLAHRYPRVHVVPLLYKVEDNLLYFVHDE